MKNICVGKPNIMDEERFFKEAKKIFKSKWLTNEGKYVRKFENKVAEFLGVKHAIAVCNGTLGLEIAARACGLERKVIVPSFTFTATAHALSWIGIEPVFCDVNPTTHQMDVGAVKRVITPEVDGIIAVHLWGMPTAIEKLEEVAECFGIPIIFDAAHAFGCSYRHKSSNKMIGNFGKAEVFSFHSTKFFNSFEGGMITTNDDEVNDKVRKMKNFGFKENVVSIGTNAKMPEICAAMGISNFKYIDKLIKKNYENYQMYRARLKHSKARLLPYNEHNKNNYQYIVIETPKRNEVCSALEEAGFIAKKYFSPGCHRSAPYADSSILLPVTERLSDSVLCLPSGMQAKEKHIEEICKIIRNISDC